MFAMTLLYSVAVFYFQLFLSHQNVLRKFYVWCVGVGVCGGGCVCGGVGVCVCVGGVPL